MSAWTRIARADANGSSTILEFTNIPNTYTDLYIRFHMRNTQNTYFQDGNTFTVNGSGSGYSWRRMWNTASGSGSGSNASFGLTNQNLTTANTFTLGEMYIPNYAGTQNKLFSYDSSTETNTSTDGWYMMIYGAEWANSAAISSIRFASGGNNFASGSFIELYGITKGTTGVVTVS
jgi:hypothetical protein